MKQTQKMNIFLRIIAIVVLLVTFTCPVAAEQENKESMVRHQITQKQQVQILDLTSDNAVTPSNDVRNRQISAQHDPSRVLAWVVFGIAGLLAVWRQNRS